MGCHSYYSENRGYRTFVLSQHFVNHNFYIDQRACAIINDRSQSAHNIHTHRCAILSHMCRKKIDRDVYLCPVYLNIHEKICIYLFDAYVYIDVCFLFLFICIFFLHFILFHFVKIIFCLEFILILLLYD